MDTRSRRFLLPIWDGGGTIPPELGVARRLIDHGNDAHVIADPTVEDAAIAAGCAFSPWRQAPHRTSLDRSDYLLKDWEDTSPIGMLKRARDRVIIGPAAEFAADTSEVIESTRPDAVIPDYMLLGAIIAAQAARLPVAPMIPNIWMLPTKGVPAIGPGFAPAKTALGRARDAVLRTITNRIFDAALPTLNTTRAAYGLEPLASAYDQVLGTERILVLTSPTFDFAASAVPGNTRYVGPILDDPSWAETWEPPWPEDNQDPLVLVAFSSTFQDQGPLLQRVVDALASLRLRAVVTLGQMLDVGEVTSTHNVTVVTSAPHRQILNEAALVVTHAGHGTTLKALSVGVPLVCIPMGRDQNDTAARVLHHGAGIRLSTRAPVTKIRAAIQTVLDDDEYRANAARLATTISRERQILNIATELETLLADTRST